jgi:pimeloyl-ACP methyl ester carboxylesterase
MLVETLLVDGMLARVAGETSCETILCIHAFADCGTAFMPLLSTPLAESFRLIVIDLAGFGASPRQDNVLTISQHADAVCAVARSMGLPGPIGLVGHSVGSMIAVEVASRLDGLFGGLFSIEGNLTAEDAYFSGRAAEFHDAYLFKQRFLDDLWNMAQTQQILRRYYATAVFADPVAMWELGRDARLYSCANASGDAYRRVQPSLYYWSSESTTAMTKSWIVGSGLPHREFGDASHWPMIDRPIEVAHAIASFFESLR